MLFGSTSLHHPSYKTALDCKLISCVRMWLGKNLLIFPLSCEWIVTFLCSSVSHHSSVLFHCNYKLALLPGTEAKQNYRIKMQTTRGSDSQIPYLNKSTSI